MMLLKCFMRQPHEAHKWTFLYSGVPTEGKCPGVTKERSYADRFNEDLSEGGKE